MKKYLALALALAMMASTLALTSCGDDSDATTTAKKNNNAATTAGTGDNSGDVADKGDTTQPTTSESYSIPDIPDPTPNTFEAQFHRYEEIENLEVYKSEHANLTQLYFDGIVMSQSIFSGNDWTDTDNEEFQGLGNEDAPNLFDCNPETKWCCGRDLVEFASAIVFGMSKPVNVTGYSITTGNDNTEWTSRNPVQWRLYACNTLPEVKITDEDEDGDTYLAAGTVPEGWILIDAVDASDPDDPTMSLVPDENFKEIGLELANPGEYQYFMFLVDWCESADVTFQLADLTLYGIDN